MIKHYRVLKSNFLWVKGAIISRDTDMSNEYKATSDVWNAGDRETDPSVSREVVESSPKFFERVYEVSTNNKVEYIAREKAQELMSKQKVEGKKKKTEDTDDEDEDEDYS